MNALKRRMEGTEEIIHELEHRTIENAQSEQERKNILEKKNRNYRTCRTVRIT